MIYSDALLLCLTEDQAVAVFASVPIILTQWLCGRDKAMGRERIAHADN